MDRRSFLKLLGGVAALPIVGKYFKFAKKATTEAPKILSEQGMPSFFYDLVAGVKKFGKPTKSTRDYDVYEYTHPVTKQKVEVIDGRNDIAIGFETDRGFRGEMGVRKGIPDEVTKGKRPPDEYYEGEQVYQSMGPDDYTKDWEEEISGGYKGLEELTSKLRESKAGGGAIGMPPISTSDPKEAGKIIIDRILGSGIESIPIYQSPDFSANFSMGVGSSRPFDYGLGFQYGDFGAGAQMYQGQPSFGISYRKEFANGGLTDTIPPEKGPMSQGIETLFQTR
jgi:hypothetical protein